MAMKAQWQAPYHFLKKERGITQNFCRDPAFYFLYMHDIYHKACGWLSEKKLKTPCIFGKCPCIFPFSPCKPISPFSRFPLLSLFYFIDLKEKYINTRREKTGGQFPAKISGEQFLTLQKFARFSVLQGVGGGRIILYINELRGFVQKCAVSAKNSPPLFFLDDFNYGSTNIN